MPLSPSRQTSGRSDQRASDVLGLGCVAVDELLFVKSWPRQDTKTEILRRERACGGLAATALVAAARLGVRAAYAGTLGPDEDSAFAVAALRREGVVVRHLLRRPDARPVRSTVVVDETAGTRNIFYSTEGACGADERHPSGVLIEACGVLMVDRFGMDGMIRAARLARRASVPVVADLEHSDVPRFEELFALADHLIVSEDFALQYTKTKHPGAAVARLLQSGREVVAVTCGPRGCWFQANSWRLPSYHPAFEVAVVDTTGCGDVFHGAYAAGLAKGLPLVERIRLASATAALKVTRSGGQAGIPSWQQVQEFLGERSR